MAVLLGPAGFGLIGLYQSVMGLMGTIAGLGIASSGVRQVAESHGSDDPERVGRTIRVLRRACWFTGLIGMLLTAALAWPMSLWTFGNESHALAIAVLGVTILLGNISGGQMALIQGLRRIGDLARVQVLSSVVGSLVSVGIYAWRGRRGIVPVLLVAAAVNLVVSWRFAVRVSVPPSAGPTWREAFLETRQLVSLGMAFVASGLLSAVVALIARVWIQRSLGLEANGLYQAAWAISGIFAGFILQAMGADFYPRLTAVANDHATVNRLVNEQTEIGILMALPLLIANLVFGPWILRLLYSADFDAAGDMLPWFMLGVFGRVLSWPVGYVILAKGAGLWFAATETAGAAIHIMLIWLGIAYAGLEGAAMAFSGMYLIFTVGILVVSHHMTGFRWSGVVMKLVAVAGLALLLTVGLTVACRPWIRVVLGSASTAVTAVACALQILRRLGPEHRLCRIVAFVPYIGQRVFLMVSRPERPPRAGE